MIMSLLRWFQEGNYELFYQNRKIDEAATGIAAAEQKEEAERLSAIPIAYNAIKTAFRIPDDINDTEYMTGERVLAKIEGETRLRPGDMPTKKGTIKYKRLVGSGENSYWAERATEHQAEKYYELVPGIELIQYLKGQEAGDPFNISPRVMFTYYERKLHRRNTFPTKQPGYSGGIEAWAYQFAAMIEDGYDKVPYESSSHYAGIRTATHTGYNYPPKEPTRLILLGERYRGDDKMKVRRLIVDGVQLPLTKENLDLAVSYAGRLVEQIFAGKEFTPGAKLQSVAPPAPQRHDAPLLRRDRAKPHGRDIK